MKYMFKKLRKKNIIDEEIDDYIASVYFLYKVCEGCEGVVSYDIAVCPICSAYKFDESFERIKHIFVSNMSTFFCDISADGK